jgi:hypothetical protein
MRKSPEISPIIVPSLVDILLTRIGVWFIGKSRLALVVLLVLFPIWLSGPRHVAEVHRRDLPRFSICPSLDPSPDLMSTKPSSADANQAVEPAVGPTGRVVQNTADVAPRVLRDD